MSLGTQVTLSDANIQLREVLVLKSLLAPWRIIHAVLFYIILSGLHNNESLINPGVFENQPQLILFDELDRLGHHEVPPGAMPRQLVVIVPLEDASTSFHKLLNETLRPLNRR